jgi:hypothetical protein
MADMVKVVTETIRIDESVTTTLSSIRCRNCNRELAPSADIEYCSDCSVYYVGKWRIR